MDYQHHHHHHRRVRFSLLRGLVLCCSKTAEIALAPSLPQCCKRSRQFPRLNGARVLPCTRHGHPCAAAFPRLAKSARLRLARVAAAPLHLSLLVRVQVFPLLLLAPLASSPVWRACCRRSRGGQPPTSAEGRATRAILLPPPRPSLLALLSLLYASRFALRPPHRRRCAAALTRRTFLPFLRPAALRAATSSSLSPSSSNACSPPSSSSSSLRSSSSSSALAASLFTSRSRSSFRLDLPKTISTRGRVNLISFSWSRTHMHKTSRWKKDPV